MAARGRRVVRRAAALVALLVCAAPASGADNPGVEQVAFTAAGQAAAKLVLIRKVDVGGGWFGGVPTYANVPFPLPCPTYFAFAPKESDLVVNGAAEARWQAPGSLLNVDTHIMQTPEMAVLAWKRWSAAPLLECLRADVRDRPFTKLVSAERLTVPRIGAFAAAYRVTVSSSGKRFVEDTILVASGRARIRLKIATVTAYAKNARAAEIGIAYALAQRALAVTACTQQSSASPTCLKARSASARAAIGT